MGLLKKGARHWWSILQECLLHLEWCESRGCYFTRGCYHTDIIYYANIQALIKEGKINLKVIR